MRRRKTKSKILLLIVLLMGIGVGYALLTQSFNIIGSTTVAQSTWDIHFDNIQVKSGSVSLPTGDSAATIDSNDDTLVNYTITLSKPGDYYEFTVDVVNEGTVDGMVGDVISKLNGTSISGTNPIPAYLDYSVTYDDTVEIVSQHLLKAGSSETFKVRVEFKRNIDNTELPSTEQTNSFSFGVTYVQADGTATVKPIGPTMKPNAIYDEEHDSYDSSDSYWCFTGSYAIKTITFGDEINPPANVIESCDFGIHQNGDVMGYITLNATDNTRYDLYIQGDGALYAPNDSSYLFSYYSTLSQINNIEVLNTSKVTTMNYMFSYTSTHYTVSPDFVLDLGSNFDTSNVTNMEGMFEGVVVGIDLGDKFDTSKVTNMKHMFYSSYFTSLDLGDKFDTSNVTNMEGMFYVYDDCGFMICSDAVDNEYDLVTIDLGDMFDTSKVTNMADMFSNHRFKSLDLGDKFYTSNVTNMSGMFSGLGTYCSTFTLDLGEHFDISHATNTFYMFMGVGYYNPNFELDISTFDFSNIIYNSQNYGSMFSSIPSTSKIWVKNSAARTWVINNGGNNNLTTSNVLIKGA